MIKVLSNVLASVINNCQNKTTLTGINALSDEEAFTKEIETRLAGMGLSYFREKKIKIGQEKWDSVGVLPPKTTPEYTFHPPGFSVDLAINQGNLQHLLELKKFYPYGNGTYYNKYFYKGTSNLIQSPKWGDAPIYKDNQNLFFTHHHEGQLWQDTLRLINASSFYAGRFIAGFFQNDKYHPISSQDFKDRLHEIMSILQSEFVNPGTRAFAFPDERCRVLSQLCDPNPQQKVYSFSNPNTKLPLYISWSDNAGFRDGIYPAPSSSTPDLISFLFEVKHA